MLNEFGLPEKHSSLSEVEKKVFELVLEFWPISALEIAAHFNEEVFSFEQKKRVSSKYCYYLKKLCEKQLVLGKRAGNSFIVWPLVVEKYRTIHNILKE